MNKFSHALSAPSDHLAGVRRIWAVFALALCLAIAPLALAGCSSGDNESDGNAATAESVQQGSSNDSSSAQESSISVHVIVDSSAADGSVTFDGAVEVHEGATVLDALKETGLALDVQDSQYGAFVNAIGDLAAGEYGSASGWIFTVNDESIAESADSYTVSADDTVTWSYLV